jgi:hypothetical protein
MQGKLIRKVGRPTTAELMAKRASAAEVLGSVNQQRMWRRFLESPDDKIALDAWKYLNDRVYGKPKQAMQLAREGGSEVQFRVIRVGVDV